MNRKPLVVGNWKMELSHKGAIEVAQAVKKLLSKIEVGIDVVICPSYPQLPAIAELLKNSQKIHVGAQQVHWEESGAFTGAVSLSQISPFIQYCIVGHSEMRELTSQTEEQVRDAALILLKHGLTPIVCLGETWEEHQQEQTIRKITQQTEVLLSGVTRTGLSKLVIAYEPIWAISAQGTGEVPDPTEVSEIVLLIRKLIASRFDTEGAERVRILYGGSVGPDTVSSYVSEPGVDGVLVGKASVTPMKFFEIVKAVQDHAR